MNTPLDEVARLNYDHHRRMGLLHQQKIEQGIGAAQMSTDDQSYKALLSHLPEDHTPNSALELGSSAGGQWSLLSSYAEHLTGIDLYAPFVQAAQRDGKPIVLGFVEDMSMFCDEVFDLVCSRHVMEHLGDVNKGIAEIHRVLKPGGYSAHVTPDMAGDNEPAHLNKLKLDEWQNVWQNCWLPLGHTQPIFEIISAERHEFNGGEVHIVAKKR